VAQKFTVPVTIRNLTSASSEAFTIYVDQDAHPRLQVQAGGRLVWGTGGVTGDVNLYRSDTNVLTTDDLFKAVSGLVTLTTNGAPTAVLPDGTLAVDTLNDDFYFRSGGEWKLTSGGAIAGDIDGGNALNDILEAEVSNYAIMTFDGEEL
jgi:hypothetical protein